MFELDVTFAVLNTMCEEELRAQHPDLLDLGLKPLELQGAPRAKSQGSHRASREGSTGEIARLLDRGTPGWA
jgi:hypothetical protein